MPIEDHAQEKLFYQLGWISGFLRRKMKKRPPQESSEDSRLMRTNKTKNLHLFLSEIMRKLKHSFKKEKPHHDRRLSGKKRRFQRSLSTKDHFFLERVTSVSPKRSHKELHDNQKHPSEMLINGVFDQSLTASEEAQGNQTRFVSLPEYSSPFSSPGRKWGQNSTRSASDNLIMSETFADDSISVKEIETASSSEGSIPLMSESNQTVDEISKVEAYNGEKEGEILKERQTSHEESLPPPVLEYVKAVLDATDSNWEELYLRTEFSDQLLNPALISNIPFYPSQLCVDHELLFDCINEVLFESCRFPQWVSSVKHRTQALGSVHEVQKEVYFHLFQSQSPHSLDQVVAEDMAKPRNWLDIRCDLECIAFETSQLILDELFEQLMLDL